MKTLSIAHRGASGAYPENTLLAFEQALKLNCDGIELDVHKSLDEKIVVFHDDYITINNIKIPIATLTFEDLQAVKLPEKQSIPLLTDVLDLIDKKCFVNIELKGIETAKRVVEIVESYVKDKNWNYGHFLISSFNKDLLMEAKFLNTEIRLAIITNYDLELAFDFAKYLKLDAVMAYFKLLDKTYVERMQYAGFKVFAWTVNQKIDIQNLKTMEINGIISDFPERI